MEMMKDNLKERLAHFEEKLKEAQHKFTEKESGPGKFGASFTTEKLKTWPEVIALIKSRISDIRKQLGKSGM